MASPRWKGEQFAVNFGDPSTQDATGLSASESYNLPGSGFGLSPPPESSPPDDGRRRRRDTPTWSNYTYTPYLDGHLWRKYGQKNIKDAEYPRLYYRCSYREDRQCLASMLMQQQNSEVPPLFHVTCTYEHTCGTPPVPLPAVIVVEQQPTTARQGLVLRFDSPGGHHDDAPQMQHHRPHQAMSSSPTSAYTMLSFGSSISQEPVFFRSDKGVESSSSFPTTEGFLPAPSSSANGDVDTWNSFSYDFDDIMHFDDDHELFPLNSNDGDDNY